jgi:DNA-binding transcriptional LysR family regulator
VDITLLKVFREVARRGSFTAAAQTLGYTQSAVSRQISTLETELGATLFDRLARGVRLTEEGRCLLPHAEAVTDRLGVALGDLRALRDLTSGRLRVGAFATAEAELVPQAIAAFRAAHPRVAVSLADGLVRAHVARLHAGELDVAIVASATPQILDGLDLHHLMDDSMFVATHPRHRMAGRDEVCLGDLAEEDWIAGSSRPEETLISPALASGFRPSITYAVEGWIPKLGMVAAGLGITLVPSLAAGAARPDIALVPLSPGDSLVRAVYAATPSGITRPPATTAFIGFLEESVTRLCARLHAITVTTPGDGANSRRNRTEAAHERP